MFGSSAFGKPVSSTATAAGTPAASPAPLFGAQNPAAAASSAASPAPMSKNVFGQSSFMGASLPASTAAATPAAPVQSLFGSSSFGTPQANKSIFGGSGNAAGGVGGAAPAVASPSSAFGSPAMFGNMGLGSSTPSSNVSRNVFGNTSAFASPSSSGKFTIQRYLDVPVDSLRFFVDLNRCSCLVLILYLISILLYYLCYFFLLSYNLQIAFR